jgi:hypothetical protein
MANKSEVIHTDPFGQVPNALLDTITMESLDTLFGNIMHITETTSTHEEWQNLQNDDDYLQKLDAFRSGVGALYLKLSQQLDKDIKKAHGVISNFWKCMVVSLFSRSLQPQKYYNLCGMPAEGYGVMVTRLANLPGDRQKILDRWNSHTTKQFVDSVWRTKNMLMEKEKEYRNTAVVIAQIGIGIGGMLIGLLSLLLALVIPYILPSPSDRKTNGYISSTPQAEQHAPAGVLRGRSLRGY